MKYLSFKSKHCPILFGEQAKQMLDYLLDTNLETQFRYTLRNPQDLNPLTEELIVFNFKNPKNLCHE